MGYAAEYPTRQDLWQRARSIGYTVAGAARLAEEAYWVEKWLNRADMCDRHPGCVLDTEVEGCEACEVIRQSEEKGYDPSRHYCDARCDVTCINTPQVVEAPKPTKNSKARAHHFHEGGYHSNACGRDGEGSADTSKTTCKLCKGTRRYGKAAHAAQVEATREAFANAGIRTEMLVRHRVSGVLGIIRTIDATCNVGYWGNAAPGVRGADHYGFATPDDLLAKVEIIRVDDLITVGSVVETVGWSYTVTQVDGSGVSLRKIGSFREGRHESPSEFASGIANGYIKITELAATGGESDPIITMINEAETQAVRDLLAVFREGAHILVRDNGLIMLAKITASGAEHVTYARMDDYTRSRTVTLAQFRGYVDNGVITATHVATDETGDVISINLNRVERDYGTLAAVSMEAFSLAGAGLHNPHHDHEIRAYYGMCCDDVAATHYHLSAMATVLASHAQQWRTRLTALVGDVILIDGRPWRIVAQRGSDPILTPCQFEQR